MRPKLKENTDNLCHCCLKESFFDIIYTKYGAKITLCWGCVEKIASKFITRNMEVV